MSIFFFLDECIKPIGLPLRFTYMETEILSKINYYMMINKRTFRISCVF